MSSSSRHTPPPGLAPAPPRIKYDHRAVKKCGKCRIDRQSCKYDGLPPDRQNFRWTSGLACDRCRNISRSRNDHRYSEECESCPPEKVLPRRLSKNRSRRVPSGIGGRALKLSFQTSTSTPVAEVTRRSEDHSFAELALQDVTSGQLPFQDSQFDMDAAAEPSFFNPTVISPNLNAHIANPSGFQHMPQHVQETPFQTSHIPLLRFHSPETGINDAVNFFAHEQHQYSTPSGSRVRFNEEQAQTGSSKSSETETFAPPKRAKSWGAQVYESYVAETVGILTEKLTPLKNQAPWVKKCVTKFISLLDRRAAFPSSSEASNQSKASVGAAVASSVLQSPSLCSVFPNVLQPCGETHFLRTVRSGDIRSIRDFLATFKGLINFEVTTADHPRVTALIFAARQGWIDIADAIIREGALVDGGDGYTTALHEAITCKNVDMVRLLLARGANPTAVVSMEEYGGKSPSERAHNGNDPDIKALFVNGPGIYAAANQMMFL